MEQMLFILGLPGSGKSAIIRYVSKYIFKKYKNRIYLFNDYAILKTMSENDTANQFKPAELGGFDVLKLDVFDTALTRLETMVNFAFNSEELAKTKIILIEFSRNDYKRAFHQFGLEFFQNAYFIHLNTEVEICKQRIAHRIAYPFYEDDYPVSEYIFEHYYYGDDGRSLPQTLKKAYGIEESRVLAVSNNYDMGHITKYVNKFIDSMMESQILQAVQTDILPTKAGLIFPNFRRVMKHEPVVVHRR